MSVFRSTYRASRRSDVSDLAQSMRMLTDDQKVVGLVVVHLSGLMRPKGILRVAMFLPGLFGPKGKAAFLTQLYQRDTEATLAMWQQTCAHVEVGKDREDRDSVGGWSQREIDLFLCLFRAAIGEENASSAQNEVA